jgi:hypothetical protein
MLKNNKGNNMVLAVGYEIVGCDIYRVCPKCLVNGTRKQKKEDTNKLTMLAFKMIPILHNTQLATFIKASGNCQERPLKESIAEPCKKDLFVQKVR